LKQLNVNRMYSTYIKLKSNPALKDWQIKFLIYDKKSELDSDAFGNPFVSLRHKDYQIILDCNISLIGMVSGINYRAMIDLKNHFVQHSYFRTYKQMEKHILDIVKEDIV